MISNGSVKFSYKTNSSEYKKRSSESLFPEMIDDQEIMIEVPYTDMNVHQYFNLFNSFLRAIGFDDITIMDGATHCAFNSDLRNLEDMKKIADRYDLILAEFAEEDEWKSKYEKLQDDYNKVLGVPTVTKETLEKAYVVCRDCGQKYGEYVASCSSRWSDKCDVCKEYKNVTEARDYDYLKKGINELK